MNSGQRNKTDQVNEMPVFRCIMNQALKLVNPRNPAVYVYTLTAKQNRETAK